jgi:hypothetical protein
MGIVVRTEHQFRLNKTVEERPEWLRPVEVEKARRFFLHGIITDASTFLVTGNIVSIELGFYALGLGNQHLLDEGTGQKLFDDEELVLIPIFLVKPAEI